MNLYTLHYGIFTKIGGGGGAKGYLNNKLGAIMEKPEKSVSFKRDIVLWHEVISNSIKNTPATLVALPLTLVYDSYVYHYNKTKLRINETVQ